MSLDYAPEISKGRNTVEVSHQYVLSQAEKQWGHSAAHIHTHLHLQARQNFTMDFGNNRSTEKNIMDIRQ